MFSSKISKTDANVAPTFSNGISMGLKKTPDWVCATLKSSSESIAQMEVSSTSGYGYEGDPRMQHLYPVLLEYFAHHAVDVDEKLPSFESKLVANPKSDSRQLSGRLSSLWYAFSRLMNPFDQSNEDDEQQGKKQKEPEPPTLVFHFGLGNARTELGGLEICIVHEALGPPISVEENAVLYRRLHLFAKDPETLKELGDAAFKWHCFRHKRDIRNTAGKYQLYTLLIECGSCYWNCEGFKASRSLSSIILPPGMLDAIVEDFREFNADDTESWYISHGLPHRRSYLFYGPAGVGKTSTIRALAGALNLSACFLSLGDSNIGNTEMQSALRTIPKPSMLVIEDIDALFNKDRKSENTSQLTFSGLLNALDGLVSADGILTVMTTNHIEKLDQALVRAGRVDRRFEFKTPTHGQIKGLFSSFYPNAEEQLAEQFADAVFSRPEKEALSIATLQEHFIFTRRKDARESVNLLNKFFTQFYPDSKTATASSMKKMANKISI